MPQQQDTSKWTICNKPECQFKNVVPSLRTRFSASRWLWQFRNDPAKMHDMRALVAKPGVVLFEQDLIDRVADLLATGKLHVHAPEEKDWGFRSANSAGGGGGGASPDSDLEMAPPFPLSDRRAERRPSAPSVREPEDDPSTLPDDSDLSSQAATLAAAAEDGSAFCEVCQQQK